MRYALEDGLFEIVAAADSIMEFEQFVKETDTTIYSLETLNVKRAEQAGIMEMLADERFQGFKKAPVIVEHISEAAKEAFNERFKIVFLKRNALVSRHEQMLDEIYVDPYLAPAEGTEARTIEELHGLDVDDQWDARTEQQREEDKAYKKAYQDAKKGGKLSGESFGPDPDKKKPDAAEESDVHVRKVEASQDQYGNIEIDEITATKGDYFSSEEETETAVDEDLVIDLNGQIAMYHKVEVTGSKLSDIHPHFKAAGIPLDQAVVERNSSIGCWAAYITQRQAENAFQVLKDAGLDVETYAVNDAGERLVPKGVQVVTEVPEGEDHPRPWNSRSAELRNMRAQEKRDNLKTQKASEFIFTGSYQGPQNGTVIYITPKSYFKKHSKMWGRRLEIRHLLPPDIVEIGPGVYQTKSRRWEQTCGQLSDLGFKETLLLQIYLNSQ